MIMAASGGGFPARMIRIDDHIVIVSASDAESDEAAAELATVLPISAAQVADVLRELRRAAQPEISSDDLLRMAQAMAAAAPAPIPLDDPEPDESGEPQSGKQVRQQASDHLQTRLRFWAFWFG